MTNVEPTRYYVEIYNPGMPIAGVAVEASSPSAAKAVVQKQLDANPELNSNVRLTGAWAF